MCHQFFLASVGAIAITGSAFAAEPAPLPPPVPVFTWSGVYLGGQIGYAWGNDNVSWSGTANDLDLAGGSFGEGPQGVIGGAHVGWNIQPNSWFVFGIEASVDGTSLRKSVAVPLADFAGDTFGSMTASSNAGVQGSVRGRLGIAFDRVLLYGTGGVAITSINTSYIDTTGFFTGVPGTNATISNTRAGFTAGGGIEYAVTDNWWVRAEYRYSNFGHTTDFPFANPNAIVQLPAGGFFSVPHHLTENQVQVGLSYRFDMMVPGPVVASGPAVPPEPAAAPAPAFVTPPGPGPTRY
ncbi:MAG: outer membrane protein [Methylocella sp.]